MDLNLVEEATEGSSIRKWEEIMIITNKEMIDICGVIPPLDRWWAISVH